MPDAMMRLVPLELCQYRPGWACGLTLPPSFNIIAHFMKNYEFGSHHVQGCPLVIKKINNLKHNCSVMKKIIFKKSFSGSDHKPD